MIDLIIPETIASELSRGPRQHLRLTTEHPASRYGLGVLLDTDDQILDGAGFRQLHNTLGVTIETDQVEAVCAALGVPSNEPGIIAK